MEVFHQSVKPNSNVDRVRPNSLLRLPRKPALASLMGAFFAASFAVLSPASAQSLLSPTIIGGNSTAGNNLGGSSNGAGGTNPAVLTGLGDNQDVTFDFSATLQDTDTGAGPAPEWASGLSFNSATELQVQARNTSIQLGASVSYVFDFTDDIWGFTFEMDGLDNGDITTIEAFRDGVLVPLDASYFVSNGSNVTVGDNGAGALTAFGPGNNNSAGAEAFSVALPLDVIIDEIVFSPTGKADGTSNGGRNGNVTLQYRGIGWARPDISLIKSSVLNDGGDGFADVGDTITYTYVVSNDGRVPLENVVLVEETFTGNNGTPTPVFQSGTGGATPAALPVGETLTYEVDYTLNADDIAAGTVFNRAEVTALPDGGIAGTDEISDLSDSTNPADAGTAGSPDEDDQTSTTLPPRPVLVTSPGPTPPLSCRNPADYEQVIFTGNAGGATSEMQLNQSSPSPINVKESNSVLTIFDGPEFSPASGALVNTGLSISSANAAGLDLDITHTFVSSVTDGTGYVMDYFIHINSLDQLAFAVALAENPGVGVTIVSGSDDAGLIPIGGIDFVGDILEADQDGNATQERLNGDAGLSADFTVRVFSTVPGVPLSEVVLSFVQDPVSNNIFEGFQWAVELCTAIANVELIKSISSVDDTNGNGLVGDPGDTVNYVFAITNTGDLPLANIVVTDLGTTLSGTSANLAPGETDDTSVTGSRVIMTTDTAAGFVENTAEVMANIANDAGVAITTAANGSDPVPTVVDTSDTGTEPDLNGLDNPVAISDPASTETPQGDGSVDADPTNDPTVLSLPTLTPMLEVVKSLNRVEDTNNNGFTDDGDTVFYDFVVTNTGNTALDDITITDTKIGLAAVAVSPDALLPGDQATLTEQSYLISTTDVDDGFVENTATATGLPVATDGSGNITTDRLNAPGGGFLPSPVDTSDSGTQPDGSTIASPATTESEDGNGNRDGDLTNDPTVLLIAPAPGVSLVKSITSITDNGVVGVLDAGDVINYGFTVTNTGNTDLINLNVVDLRLGFTSPTIANLPIGASTSAVTATYTILAADVADGGIENTATVDGDAVDSAGNPIVDPNDPTSTLTVFDDSDSGTEPQIDAAGNPVTVTDPETVETPDLAGDTDGETDNDPTVLVIPNASISLIKSVGNVLDTNGDGLFGNEGDDIVYTFAVTNTGTTDLANITITDDGFESGPTTTNPTGLTSALPVTGGPIDLAVGAGDTLTFTATREITPEDFAAGIVQNSATVTGDAVDGDGNPLNGPGGAGPVTVSDVSDAGSEGKQVDVTDPEGTETADINGATDGDLTNDPTVQLLPGDPKPEIELVKSVASVADTNNSGTIDAGDTVTYAFSVTNVGNVRLDLVGLDDQRANPVIGGPVILEVGETDTTTFSATAVISDTEFDAGQIENTATASGRAVNSLGDPLIDPATGNPRTTTDTSDTGTAPDIGPDGTPVTISDPAGQGTDADPTVLRFPMPELEIVKSVASVTDTNGNGQTDEGDVVNYTFAVTNTGNADLQNVTVTDALPGLTLSAAGAVGDLDIGETDTSLTATYALTDTDVAAGAVENTAEAAGEVLSADGTLIGDPVNPGQPLVVTDTSDAGTAPNGDPVGTPGTEETPDIDGNTNGDPTDDPTVFTLTPSPQLELLKTIANVTDVNGDGLVNAGDTVDYAFTVTNTGNVDLQGIFLEDSIATVVGGPIDLAIGETDSATFTATYTLDQDDVNAGGVENTAEAEGTAVDSDGNPIPDPLSPGSPLLAKDDSDSGSETEIDNTGQVPPLGTDPETTETPDLAGGTDGDPTNDPTVLFVANPQISLIKSVANVFDTNGDGLFGGENDEVVFSFLVRNVGNVDVAGITIADSLGPVTGGPVDLAVGAGDSLTFSATYLVQAADITRGYIENTATATGDAVDADGNPVFGPDGAPLEVSDVSDAGTTDDQETVTDPEGTETADGVGDTDGDPTNDPTVQVIPANPNPDLTLIKSVDAINDVNGNNIVDAGDIITYAFSVTNTGNVRLADVTIEDPRAAPVSGGPITLELGETDDTTFTASATVTAGEAAAGAIENTADANGNAVNSDGDPITDPDTGAQLSATDTSDAGTEPNLDPTGLPPAIPDPGGDGTMEDPTVLALSDPSIEIVKSVANVFDTNGDGVFGGVSDEITYSFVVTNSGNTDLTNIFVTDLTASVSGGPIDLAAGASNSSTFMASYTVTAADLAAGFVENTADVFGDAVDDDGNPVLGLDGDPLSVTDVSDAGTDADGADVPDPGTTNTPTDPDSPTVDDADPTNDPTTISIPTAAAPAITLTKTVLNVADTDNDAVTGGVDDVVTYAFEVMNSGNTDLENVVVTDPLLGGDVGTVPFLAIGESASVFGFYTVTIADEERGFLENSATTIGDSINAAGDPFLDPATGEQLTAEDVSDTGTDRETDGVPDNETTETSDGSGGTDGDPTNDPTVVNIPLEPSRAAISGLFFEDNNRNGIFDEGVDDRLPGFRVVLRNSDDEIVAETVTAADGTYEMSGFAIGTNYRVEFIDPDTGEIAGQILGLNFERDTVLTDQNGLIASEVGTDVVSISKTTSLTSVILGQSVPYVIEVQNNGDVDLAQIAVVDTLPPGLSFTPGSATFDGADIVPVIDGDTLTFGGLSLTAGDALEITLRARVNTIAQPGALTNTAIAIDEVTGNPITEESSATVFLRPEAVFDCGDVIGKVFDDRNMNGYQDAAPDQRTGNRAVTDQNIFDGKLGGKLTTPPRGEPGIPGVRVVTQTGTIITTDEYGRFNVPCAELPDRMGTNFSLKIDERSLPTGYRVTTENPRTMRLTAGIMTEMNFGAAIGRVVNVDLTAAAFEAGTVDPSDRLEQGLVRLLAQVSNTPSVVRLSYFHNGEDQDAMRARLSAVEDFIENEWAGVGEYRLIVERTIKRLQ